MTWELAHTLQGKEGHEAPKARPMYEGGDATESGDQWDCVVALQDREKHAYIEVHTSYG